METQAREKVVRESNRATIRCKYSGNGARITVSRYESNTWGHSLNTGENYREAVRQYVERADWDGVWITSTITDGAVAVWAGYAEDGVK
jgi:hypothetical protein